MNLGRSFYDVVLAPLALARRHRPRAQCEDPRILVIRRNRMGDMICTLPLLQALRRRYPYAHLAVVCDASGFPIARACSAVNQVVLLKPGWNRWQAIFRNAWHLQDYDWVIAAKGGFDRRLALLSRATHAARRIGYENTASSALYTDPVAIPGNLWEIHQIEAALRLLAPFGIPVPADPVADLKVTLPPAARAFATGILERDPFARKPRLALINLSSTTPVKFTDEDFARLIADLIEQPDLAVGLVGISADQPRARKLAERTGDRAASIATPGPLELAALLEKASFFITGEGGAAHLASTVGTATVVLWSEGPFEKWYSRGANHTFVRLDLPNPKSSQDQVREALRPYL